MAGADLAVEVGDLHPETVENLEVEPERKNRRTANRYDLDLPFDFRLFGRDQSVQEGRGRTLNMSSHGLLVSPDLRISKGQPIELFVHLPGQLKDAAGARLVILGHVLRSSHAGAAIKIVRHGFIRVRESGSPPSQIGE
jgi:hypothetical protein